VCCVSSWRRRFGGALARGCEASRLKTVMWPVVAPRGAATNSTGLTLVLTPPQAATGAGGGRWRIVRKHTPDPGESDTITLSLGRLLHIVTKPGYVIPARLVAAATTLRRGLGGRPLMVGV
jgi:hypothetical protein